jgi:hypothetical protein
VPSSPVVVVTGAEPAEPVALAVSVVLPLLLLPVSLPVVLVELLIVEVVLSIDAVTVGAVDPVPRSSQGSLTREAKRPIMLRACQLASIRVQSCAHREARNRVRPALSPTSAGWKECPPPDKVPRPVEGGRRPRPTRT